MSDRYNVSKLLEVFAVREMAARAGLSYPVTINCLNPGFCHSELSRESGFALWLMKLLLARTTEVGSRAILAAAAAGTESHGKYMSDSVVVDPSELVMSEEGATVQKKLWTELTGTLEKIRPGVTANL